MRSIKEIFVIGHGPSSSHTMGPAFAADYIINKYKGKIQNIKIILYGSLALTGKGHLTEYILKNKLQDYDPLIIYDYQKELIHPNTMDFIITLKNKEIITETISSIGGGTIISNGQLIGEYLETYPHQTLTDIIQYCKKENINLTDYVLRFEKDDILTYLEQVYDTMETSRNNGISKSGELPGNLHVQRKARQMYLNMRKTKDGKNNIYMNVAISSFAVAEENASGGIIVTAPTCGSAGVIPGVITYLKLLNYSRKDIIDGLCVAGLIGMIAKTNASISGAECGCQAEIGVACAMSAAMIASVLKYDIDNVAQAAEIAMEHSLGLTCDPVDGYVQIPCIERCAIFAMKAIDAATMAKIIPSEQSKVNFDVSIKTMYNTGKDLLDGYRETAKSGLAKELKNQ